MEMVVVRNEQAKLSSPRKNLAALLAVTKSGACGNAHDRSSSLDGLRRLQTAERPAVVSFESFPAGTLGLVFLFYTHASRDTGR